MFNKELLTSVALAISLLPAVSTVQAQEIQPLNVKTSCVPSHSPSNDTRFLLPPHIEVEVSGKIKASEFPSRLIPISSNVRASAEVIWTLIRDGGRIFTYGNDSIQSPNVSIHLDGYLPSIRPVKDFYQENLLGDPRFVRPFRTYSIMVGKGPFTENGNPYISDILATGAFNANCESLPSWSYPLNFVPRADRLPQAINH